MGVFTEFERDETATSGVMWRDFVTAVGIFVYTNEGRQAAVTVAAAAMAFNTTPALVREAIGDHYWLSSRLHNGREIIESDGE